MSPEKVGPACLTMMVLALFFAERYGAQDF
jgi:hypothetical protein